MAVVISVARKNIWEGSKLSNLPCKSRKYYNKSQSFY